MKKPNNFNREEFTGRTTHENWLWRKTNISEVFEPQRYDGFSNGMCTFIQVHLKLLIFRRIIVGKLRNKKSCFVRNLFFNRKETKT